ncbi:MAG: DNA polymerase IV [Clostridia bacterium]
MNTNRTILHCDCNAYFASVESIARPELKAVPMAVCGDPKSRHGVILAKNELAKGYGIVTAETVWQALKKCPVLTLVPPHHDLYEVYCQKINAIYNQYTDQVEMFSVDESWLDVTGSLHLFGTGREIADALRRRVREELGITISVGVSFNKIFAKLGSDYQKPDATTEITPENYRKLLFPLPARDMMFVGKMAAETLQNVGIQTIGDIVTAGKERMLALLGRSGESIWFYASGLDCSPVKRYDATEKAKSVGSGTTFARDLVGMQDIRSGLLMLCDQVGTRLRRQGQFCTTVQVLIKDPRLITISRQQKLASATNVTKELFDTTVEIVSRAWPQSAPIRMLTVTATGLTDNSTVQMRLLDDSSEQRQKNAKLDVVMDDMRSKYGKDALTYASTVRRIAREPKKR